MLDGDLARRPLLTSSMQARAHRPLPPSPPHRSRPVGIGSPTRLGPCQHRGVHKHKLRSAAQGFADGPDARTEHLLSTPACRYIARSGKRRITVATQQSVADLAILLIAVQT